jgi:hypothetical protein
VRLAVRLRHIVAEGHSTPGPAQANYVDVTLPAPLIALAAP